MNLGYKKRPRWERTRRVEILRCAQNDTISRSRRLSIQRLEILRCAQNDTVMTRGQVGFTLIEMLVVMGVIAILLSILAPAIEKAREHARQWVGICQMKKVVEAYNLFAFDHKNKYFPSKATVGARGTDWSWSELMTMITYNEKGNKYPFDNHRSIGAYLSSYVEDPDIFYCLFPPNPFPYAQEAWQIGDGWDNPETREKPDPHFGSLSYYAGYKGWLPEFNMVFEGPRNVFGGGDQSDLLVSCTLVYNNWRAQWKYMSCEKIREEGIISRSANSIDFWWTQDGGINIHDMQGKLKAGYAPGHVKTYSPSETTVLEVSSQPTGRPPIIDHYGSFRIPMEALE